MTPLLQNLWLVPILLYAETHYRFRYFFSLLKKAEPEIIADAPHRLEPGCRLPVLILVKDAHIYPSTLEQVTIEVRQGDRTIERVDHLDRPIRLDQRLFTHILEVDVPNVYGWVDLDVSLTLDHRGRTRTYHNDNHRTSSRRPLRIFLSENPLPRFPDLYLGDPHIHSSFTADQVEFGAPLGASLELSRAMGLSFFCVTDHSYDLDDHVDSYLTNDPDVPKWRVLQSEVDALNSRNQDFAIVRGEEVSCRNERGRNVHLLLFGQKEFVLGSGDGAEKWLRTRSEHTIRDALQLRSDGSVAFAAHAKEPVPFLQRLLLGRGIWSDRDLELQGMSGLQIMNGKFDDGFREGYKSWIRHLLRGRRLYALAGDDAHGNFNRFRQVGVPFLSIREGNFQMFGSMRTGLYLDGTISEEAILQALANGNAIMSNGPVARISRRGTQRDDNGLGDRVGDSINIAVEALSSPEFGEIASLQIIVGKRGEPSERVAFRFDGNQGFSLQKDISIRESTAGYARVEVMTSKDNLVDQQQHFCYTNPYWFSPSM